MLQDKSIYLNVPFFLVRAAVYFAAWLGLSWCLNRWSLDQDRTADVRFARRLQLFSGPGIAVYGLTVTFASVDWVMSLDPHWFSHIFGALWVVGQALAAFAFVIAALVLLSGRKPLADVMRPAIYHDLGKLLLAFVMVWAYFSFSQYLIIWSGNLPEEITWYVDRSHGGWLWMSAALPALHFALPFVLLLSRDLKRDARRLAAVAIGVFAMRFVDVYWVMAPTFEHERFAPHWLDAVALVGIGGLWIAAFLWQLGSRPLLPLNDPWMEESFEAVAGGGH
jgi:hypothetical protein